MTTLGLAILIYFLGSPKLNLFRCDLGSDTIGFPTILGQILVSTLPTKETSFRLIL